MRVVITGGSRGIGLAIRYRLDDAGFEVHSLARTTGTDVTDPQLERWLDELAPVDAVVTCAGIAPSPTRLVDLGDDDWYESLDVNLTHHMRVARWFVRQGRPGAIILIASTAGTRPSPNWTAYAAAKAGLINLGLSIAAETADDGIRTYVVAPGRCATELRRVLAPDEDPTTIMQPDEVARVVLGLLQDETGVMSGQVIEVARRATIGA